MKFRRRTHGQLAGGNAPDPTSRNGSAESGDRFGLLLFRLRQLRQWARRWVSLIVFALFIGWISLMAELRIVALGAIDAETMRISPAFPSQIASVAVRCDDAVKAGQSLAIVRNEIMVQQYRTEYARVEAELKQTRNAYNAKVAAAEEVTKAAEHQFHAATKVRENVVVLRDAMEPLWKRQQITLTDWLEIDNNWLKALSNEAAAEATWRSRAAEAERTRLETQEQIAGLEARLVELGKLLDLSAHAELRTDLTGVVTKCERKAGEVVAAGEPVMEIQSEETPTVLAYVAAADLSRIKVGMGGLVFLATRDQPLRTHVTALPVQVGRLPGSLKRYFWQGQEWQQYAPVRLKFNDDERELLANLRDNERVDVLFEMYPGLKIPVWILNIF